MTNGSDYKLVFYGPKDESAETLRLLKAAFVAELNFEVAEVQRFFTETPAVIQEGEEGELKKTLQILQKAGAQVRLIAEEAADLLDTEEEDEDGFEFQLELSELAPPPPKKDPKVWELPPEPGDLSFQEEENSLIETLPDLAIPSMVTAPVTSFDELENKITENAQSFLSPSSSLSLGPEEKSEELSSSPPPSQEEEKWGSLSLSLDESADSGTSTKSIVPPPTIEAPKEALDLSLSLDEEETPPLQEVKTTSSPTPVSLPPTEGLSLPQEEEESVPELTKAFDSLFAGEEQEEEVIPEEPPPSVEAPSLTVSSPKEPPPSPPKEEVFSSSQPPPVAVNEEVKKEEKQEAQELSSVPQIRRSDSASSRLDGREPELVTAGHSTKKRGSKIPAPHIVLPLFLGSLFLGMANFLYFSYFNLEEEGAQVQQSSKQQEKNAAKAASETEAPVSEPVFTPIPTAPSMRLKKGMKEGAFLTLEYTCSLQEVTPVKCSLKLETPLPRDLTAEEIVKGIKREPWLKRLEVDNVELSGSDTLTGEGLARGFIDYDGTTTRITVPLLLESSKQIGEKGLILRMKVGDAAAISSSEKPYLITPTGKHQFKVNLNESFEPARAEEVQKTGA